MFVVHELIIVLQCTTQEITPCYVSASSCL